MAHLSNKELLPDGVWARLDPHAGRLSRRQARQIWALVTVVGMLAALTVPVWRSGVLVPRIDTDDTTGSSGYEPASFTISVRVTNHGWRPVTVTAVGRDGPGLTLDRVFGAPYTLPAGGAQDFVLRYRVTDCATVPSGEWPVQLELDRWFGTQTVYAKPPAIDASEPERQWQRALADGACGRPG